VIRPEGPYEIKSRNGIPDRRKQVSERERRRSLSFSILQQFSQLRFEMALVRSRQSVSVFRLFPD